MTIATKTRNYIIKITGRLPDEIKSFLPFIKQNFDENILIWKFFSKIGIKKGVMFDVGACFGNVFAPYLMRNWDVFAFEPDPNPCKIECLDWYKRNNLHNLHLFDFALSDKAGIEIPFYVSDESTGVSTLNPFLESHHIGGKIKTETLKNFIFKNNIKSIDFLKVDTEGHDYLVLKGFPWSNDQVKPKIIMCEFENSKTIKLGYEYNEFGNYIIQQGYAVWLSEWEPIITYGKEHKWKSIKKFPCKLNNNESWGNFIAVKNKYSDLFQEIIDNMSKY